MFVASPPFGDRMRRAKRSPRQKRVSEENDIIRPRNVFAEKDAVDVALRPKGFDLIPKAGRDRLPLAALSCYEANHALLSTGNGEWRER